MLILIIRNMLEIIEESFKLELIDLFYLNNSRPFYNINSTVNDLKARSNSITTNYKILDTYSRIVLFNS